MTKLSGVIKRQSRFVIVATINDAVGPILQECRLYLTRNATHPAHMVFPRWYEHYQENAVWTGTNEQMTTRIEWMNAPVKEQFVPCALYNERWFQEAWVELNKGLAGMILSLSLEEVIHVPQKVWAINQGLITSCPINSKDQYEAMWADTHCAVSAVLDTPVSRRKMPDEYSEDARKRLRAFNEFMLTGFVGKQNHTK